MRIKWSHAQDPMDEGTINLTPLIDVVFVVLIMFIIIAPLIEIDRIALASGKPVKKHAPMHQKPITIHVKADNTIWINHKCIPEQNLGLVLKELFEAYPNQTPQLYHDKCAYFGTYQKVKNALETVGFEQMDVILKND